MQVGDERTGISIDGPWGPLCVHDAPCTDVRHLTTSSEVATPGATLLAPQRDPSGNLGTAELREAENAARKKAHYRPVVALSGDGCSGKFQM